MAVICRISGAVAAFFGPICPSCRLAGGVRRRCGRAGLGTGPQWTLGGGGRAEDGRGGRMGERYMLSDQWCFRCLCVISSGGGKRKQKSVECNSLRSGDFTRLVLEKG